MHAVITVILPSCLPRRTIMPIPSSYCFRPKPAPESETTNANRPGTSPGHPVVQNHWRSWSRTAAVRGCRIGSGQVRNRTRKEVGPSSRTSKAVGCTTIRLSTLCHYNLSEKGYRSVSTWYRKIRGIVNKPQVNSLSVRIILTCCASRSDAISFAAK